MKPFLSIPFFFNVCVCIFLGLLLANDLQAQKATMRTGTISSGNGDDDWKIKASRNTVPSSGHDKDLLVLRVSGNSITSQPIKTTANLNLNPGNMQTRQLNQNKMSGDAPNSYNRSQPAIAMKKEAPANADRIALTRLKPLSQNIVLTILRPLVQGQASLLLKSPSEVNFIANEAEMLRSSAIASFLVQKGKSYIVTAHTRMMPDRRSREVSLNLNYATGGENTSVSLSKTAKSANAESYEFQAVLVAEGNGYINLSMQNENNSARWWFSRVEVQQVGY